MAKRHSRNYKIRKSSQTPVPNELKNEARVQKALGVDIPFRDGFLNHYFIDQYGRNKETSRGFREVPLSVLSKLQQLDYLEGGSRWTLPNNETIFNFIKRWPMLKAGGHVELNPKRAGGGVHLYVIEFKGNPGKTFLIALLELMEGRGNPEVKILPSSGGYTITLEWSLER